MTGSPPTRRGRGLVLAGVVLIVASVLAGLAFFAAAGSRSDRMVEAMARMPSGCDTELEFERGGEFLVYLETTGRLDQLQGACEAPAAFDRPSSVVPRVRLTITDPVDGSVLALTRVSAGSYDTGDFAGQVFRGIRVDRAGTYIARVETPDGESVVLAVGPDPAKAAEPLRNAALLVGLGGVLAGVAAMITGLVRRVSRPEESPESPPGATLASGRAIRPPSPPSTVATTVPPGAPPPSAESPFARPTGLPQPPPGATPVRQVQPGEFADGRPVSPPVVLPAAGDDESR